MKKEETKIQLDEVERDLQTMEYISRISTGNLYTVSASKDCPEELKFRYASLAMALEDINFKA